MLGFYYYHRLHVCSVSIYSFTIVIVDMHYYGLFRCFIFFLFSCIWICISYSFLHSILLEYGQYFKLYGCSHL